MTRVNTEFQLRPGPIVVAVEERDVDAADRAAEARLEAFVEPFEEAQPGPHVVAAVEAMEAVGVEVDLGALATTVDGTVDDLVAAASAMLHATFEQGATAVQLRIERT